MVAEAKVVQENYWKEIQDEIPIILEDLSGIVLGTYNSIEFTDIIDF